MNRDNLKSKYVYSNNTVNIFTDASLRKDHTGRTTTCAGVVVYVGNTLIFQDSKILPQTTVNQGELYAIKMGVIEAVKMKNMGYSDINLFSDSQGSIFALRDRIFKWINNVRDDKMHGYDGPIQNSSMMFEIIYMINDYKLNINLYHTKGHLRANNLNDINIGKKVFAISNNVNYNWISDNFIVYLINGNNQVDKFTGYILDKYYIENMPKYNPCLEYLYTPKMDFSLYRSLINNK